MGIGAPVPMRDECLQASGFILMWKASGYAIGVSVLFGIAGATGPF